MYVLTIVTETYSRTESGKSWRSKPDEVETEEYPWDRRDTFGSARYGEDVHRNITAPATLSWFRRIGGSEYAERSYTPVGYIVTRLISTSPSGEVRKIQKFRITDNTPRRATLAEIHKDQVDIFWGQGAVWAD